MGAFADSYCQYTIPDVLAAACSRTTALSSQVAAAVASTSGQEVQRLQRLLHALPDSPDLWYCLALATLLQAIGDGQCTHFRKALRCSKSALQAVRQLLASPSLLQRQQQPLHQQQGSAGVGSGLSLLSCSEKQLQEVEVRLMVAISECHQHSRLPGCHDAAHEWAMDALTAAMQAGGAAAATAHRQVGRMLALEGMVVEAEMAYRQAVAASGGECPAAQLELAKLLVGQGRQQEAVQILHTIWHAAAEGLPAQPTAAALTAAVPPGQNFAEAAALEEALLLADLGQVESAHAAVAAALKLAAHAAEAAPAAAELVTATVALEAAAVAAPDAMRNLLLEARWAASSAAKSGLALPGTVGTAAAGVGAAVLAQVELRRNKPEKAYDAIGMSFGAWVDHAVPPQLLMAAGELSGEVADCAAAVHTAPWMRPAWERLQLAAAAQGRPILID
jgi:tetratricopeptide (TPR) repeat protein